MAETFEWEGISGGKYKYWIYEIGHEFAAQPANYIFAQERPGTWRPIYVGQTGDLSERFDYHHKMDCIRGNGSTHIHAHKSSADEAVRQAEETDLVRRLSPVCNQ